MTTATTGLGPQAIGGMRDTRSIPARIAARLRDVWIGMDGAGHGRRIVGTGTVAITAMVLQLVVAFFVVGAGANLWYSDALSHLTIAGRITNGFNAGIQQLGTVWLPAPHLLMAPLASNEWLWETGWCAAILGVLAMGAASAAVYRIAARIGLGRIGRLTAVAVFVLNANILYTFTTALTEPVLLATVTMSIAGLAHYATASRPLSRGELALFAGLPAAIAALSRYEGWILVVTGLIFIFVIDLRRFRSMRRGVLSALGFVAIPAAAIVTVPAIAMVWWVAYNYVNYGNPLEFIFGEYSAYAQQAQAAATATLTTAHHLDISLMVFGSAVWEVAGGLAVVLGVAGFGWMLLRRGFGVETIIVGVLLSPVVFHIAALYIGQTSILNDFSAPTGLFNLRFALTAMPFLAVGAGVLLDAVTGPAPRRFASAAIARAGGRPNAWRWAGTAILAAVVAAFGVSTVYVASDFVDRSPLAAEGYNNFAIGRAPEDPLWAYISEHYDDTRVLIDEVTTGVRPQAGIPLSEYYLLAAGDKFEAALAKPAASVGWIFVNTTDERQGYHVDQIWKAMQEHPENFTAFTPVAEVKDHVLFRRTLQ